MDSLRPPKDKRCFSSPAVESLIAQTCGLIRDSELAWLFSNCFPNTLDTTVTFSRDAGGKSDTFIITGDIDAMWLRDSTNQVWPYLSLTRDDPALAEMIRGLICRQAACVMLDPYANAFCRAAEGVSHWQSDATIMKPGVHERKYELDSLASVLRLATEYFRVTRDATPFDAAFLRAVSLIIKTVRDEQADSDEQPKPAYFFQRQTDVAGDTLALYGNGNPIRRTGMARSAFRPSDDGAIFQYLIPANAMMAVMLGRMAATLEELKLAPHIAEEARQLGLEISFGIQSHGVVKHPNHGLVFAYEVDGYGGVNLMDDANLPSLLALPYFGFCLPTDDIYLNTRRFILSGDNPYFAKGTAACGVGSPHIGRDFIWPLGLIAQAITSTDDEEIAAILQSLKTTHAGTGFMHESFNKNDPSRFTRPWFAWANTFFGELIIRLATERPELLRRP